MDDDTVFKALADASRTMSDGKTSFVYVSSIRTMPEKLWEALTSPAFMKQYWFGMHCESDWTQGASWQLVSGDGVLADPHPACGRA